MSAIGSPNVVGRRGALPDAAWEPAPETLPRIAKPALIASLGVGTLLRLIHYGARPSLLIDEARLALNLGSRSWLALARPLDYDQTAPLLFLWAEKLAARLGGMNEYSLRALPFLAGVAALPLLFVLTRRLLGFRAATLAIALAALSPQLIQYSGEIKPYTLDLLITLGLGWLALDLTGAAEDRRRRMRLALAGVVAVWLSAPAILTLAAVGLALVVTPVRSQFPRWFLPAIAFAWGASFALAYGLIYGPAAHNPYMQQFWQASLLTLWRPGWVSHVWPAVRELVWALFIGGTTEPPLSWPATLAASLVAGIALVIGAVGTRRIQRTAGWQGLILIMGPVLAGLGASLVGGYPVAGRVMTYAAASLVISVAAGSVALSERSRVARRLAVALLGACFLVPPLFRDIALALRPTAMENIRSAVARLERDAQPSDPIYVFAATLPAWTFYTTDWTAPDTARLSRMARLGSSGGPAFENAPPRTRAIGDEGDSLVYSYHARPEIVGLFHGAQWRSATGPVQYHADTNWTTNEARRIRLAAKPDAWVLMAHSHALERFLLPALEKRGGRIMESYEADGARLWRFSFTPGSAP